MGRRKWTLVVVAAAEALIIVDISFGAMVIDDVTHEFRSSIGTIQGILAGYALVVAILTLAGGRLAARWSPPVAMRIGLLIRAVGAAVTATAFSVISYGIGEAVIAGIGMALVSPSTTASIGSLFRGRDSARAFAVIGAAIAIAGGLGPVVGGWITTHLSWRWCNWFEFALSLALVIGSLAIPRIARVIDGSRFDWIGLATSGIAFAAIVIGLDEAVTWGWWNATDSPISIVGLSLSPVLVMGGLVMLAAFLAIERRRRRLGLSVLIDPDLLRIRGLRTALLTTLAGQAALAGLLVVVPIHLQVVQGRTAFESGLFLLPMSGAAFVAAALFPRLARHRSVRTLAVIAGSCMVLSAVLVYWDVDPSIWGTPLLLGLAVFGIGSGILDSQLDTVAQLSVEPSQESAAAGLQCTADNFGSAIGIALATTVLLLTLQSGIVSFLHRHPGMSDRTATAAMTHLEGEIPMVDLATIDQYARSIGSSPAERTSMVEGYRSAQYDALEYSLLIVAAIGIIVIVAAARLPSRRLDELDDTDPSSEGSSDLTSGSVTS